MKNLLKRKNKKFIITIEFEVDAKNVTEALGVAQKLRDAVITVKEKNNE